jgi:hypothetical protein
MISTTLEMRKHDIKCPLLLMQQIVPNHCIGNRCALWITLVNRDKKALRNESLGEDLGNDTFYGCCGIISRSAEYSGF